MTKSDFILSLSEALTHLSGYERVRVLEYYEEMIDDRIENGMIEEDAVAAMGSIEEILKEAAPDALNAGHDSSMEIGRPSAKQITFCEPIEDLVASICSAELHVLNCDLPDGVTARIDYNLSENEQCDCMLTNGRLEVHYRPVQHRNFSFRSLFSGFSSSIIISLAKSTLANGDIGSSSGNVDLSDIAFTNSLEAKTARAIWTCITLPFKAPVNCTRPAATSLPQI